MHKKRSTYSLILILILCVFPLKSANFSYTLNSIDQQGVTILKRNVDITDPFHITTSNATLDMNGKTIRGGILIGAGLRNITIKNGIVDPTISTTAVYAQAGCENIQLVDLTIRNAEQGILFENVVNSFIKNCELSSNTTGAQIYNSANIVFEKTIAISNTHAGFCLLSSTTCCLRDCKAISTGLSNNNVLHQTVFGFASTDGYGNIFERCIANATQALSTTDSQSLVAGFALRGSEGCSKIINCEAANATTNENGVTVPYGILLEASLDELIAITAIFNTDPGGPSFPSSSNWSPDGNYIAVADEGVSDALRVYRFDRISGDIILADAIFNTDSGGPSSPSSSNWSPDGNYIAVADNGTPDALRIYRFDRVSERIVFVDAILDTDLGGPSSPLSSNWSPDGSYIAVADGGTPDALRIYRFDRISERIVFVDAILDTDLGGPDSPLSSNWSPDGSYIAVADGGIPDALRIYRFDRGPGNLTFVDAILNTDLGGPSSPLSSNWSPDGSYIAVADGGIPDALRVYRFDRGLGNLTFVDAILDTDSGGPDSPLSSNWSPDGSYIAVADGGTPDGLRVYRFDRGPGNLTFVDAILDTDSGGPDSPLSSNWSPDGSYIAVVDEGTPNALRVYSALIFPSKNVIKGNIVYCNSGGEFPSGVGISGSSITNMIIGNTAYSNPVQQNSEEGGPIVGSNYYFVTNIFNQLFGNAPSALQNISIGDLQPTCMPADIGLIVRQANQKTCDAISRFDVFESKLDGVSIPCASTAIFAGPIATEGSYCLIADIAGGLSITESNVILDLNGRSITGGISFTGRDNILIKNGTVENSGSDGIAATSSTNIILENLLVKNSLIGANFVDVTGGSIKNCTFTSNTTGVELNNSHKITINNSMAKRNMNAGFCLITSSTCCLINCKALSTGEGNSNITDQTIFGFVATNGNGNIFENCIANGTQGLLVTDIDSLIAGFALRRNESCTKIIDCESANSTSDDAGVVIPYGILLEGTLGLSLSLTGVPPIPEPGDTPLALDWSPDNNYLAVGLGSSDSKRFRIYQFDPLNVVLSQVVFPETADVPNPPASVDWHPNGQLIALGSNPVDIFKFDTITRQLQLLFSQGGFDAVYDVKWSPDGRYFAVAFNEAAYIQVYSFDVITNTVVLVATPSVALSSEIFTLDWRPDGKFLASGELEIIRVFEFSASAGTLIEVDNFNRGSGENYLDIEWSFDGKFLASGSDTSESEGHISVFTFENDTITQVEEIDIGAFDTNSVSWSKDGRYLAVGTASTTASERTVRVYSFNRENSSPAAVLTLELSTQAPNDVESVTWSPDGSYIATGILSESNDSLVLYTGLFFPSNNVIKDNVVYCNSGNKCPGGIGISGSSISNYIVGNTAYSNPLSPAIIGSNYMFVVNVFNQQFGNGPSLLQNISLDGNEPICTPGNLALLLKQSCAKVVDFALCGPTALTANDISGGTFFIAESGNYCLGENIAADVVITTTCVYFDLNDHCLSGVIDVATSEHIIIANGTICPPAGSAPAAIAINSTVLNALVQNVSIACADAISTGVGREGIAIAGHNVQIKNCTIKSGSAVGAGNDGGDGILIQADSEKVLIQECTIITGNGGDSTNASVAGNGGHGISVASGAVNVEILSCLVEQTGNGGNSSSTGNGGNGGDGIAIASGAVDVSVTQCTLRNTGLGGSSIGGMSGLGGYAVNDQVTTSANLSQIFANFAHNIASATKFDLQAAGIETGTLTPNPPTATVINPFSNVFS